MSICLRGCAPVRVCVCVRASFAHKPVGQNLHVRACLRYVRPASVCVCAWEHHFRLTALTHTQSVSLLPSSAPLEKSTHLPPNGKSMCRQCVQRGSSCATHNHSLSRFLHSNHSTIIIIVIILVQRSVNVLMTLE